MGIDSVDVRKPNWAEGGAVTTSSYEVPESSAPADAPVTARLITPSGVPDIRPHVARDRLAERIRLGELLLPRRLGITGWGTNKDILRWHEDNFDELAAI